MSHPFKRQPLPSETAPLVGQFGEQAHRITALLRLDPDLALRFVLAPRRAIHASAALVQAHAAAGVAPESTAALLAEAPRTVLRAAIPDAHPRLYRLLERASLPTWSLDAYQRLNQVLLADLADQLPEEAEFRPALVDEAAELIQGDPIIRRARMGFRGEHYRKELAVVIEMLRELGALRDLNDLPEGAGANAVIRRMISDLGRVAPPHVPFPDIPGWRRITDVKDLWDTGKQMLVCLRPGYRGSGDYVVSHIMGRSVFLSHTSHSVLVQFRQLPGGVWALGQCSGR